MQALGQLRGGIRAMSYLHGPVLAQMKRQLISMEGLIATPPRACVTAIFS